MRKEAGFEVVDHIRIYPAEGREVEQSVSCNREQSAADTLADDIVVGSLGGYVKQWDINGRKATFGVEKI